MDASQSRLRFEVPFLLILFIGLMTGSIAVAGAQTALAPKAPVTLDAPIPLDPAVRLGTLPNGLTYYIRHNQRPDDRVLLRLAVKAGSIDEADDQRGLAHVLEHMAFNGSKHFAPGDLVSKFEAIGSRLGPHLNAYTSFEETVYMLQVPTDREGFTRLGLLALSDFAGRLSLEPAEIDKERGVVIEEWRGGLGAQSRIRDKQLPILFHGSRYAERLPIGDPQILKSFPAARLRAFYETWYRPDLMAVVIVGDIDVDGMEKMVRELFGDLQKPAVPVPARSYDATLQNELLASAATDPEITQSSVSIVRKHRAETAETVAGFRRTLVRWVMEQMFNERLDELARKSDAAFLGASAQEESLSKTVQAFTLAARVEEENITRSAAALEIEGKRVREHGFGPAELTRSKAQLAAVYERAFAERDKTESGALAAGYLSHFLEDEPAPSIEHEYELVKQLLPALQLTDANQAARDLLGAPSRVVLAVAPQKEGLAVPDEKQLIAAVEAASKTEVTPWVESAGSSTLMDKDPEAGKVVGRRRIDEIDVTIVRFANGVEAWLKPTDFKNDQILFTLFAQGGSSIVPPEKYFEAALLPSLVGLSGVGGHSATELERLLAGKLASASLFVSLSIHGVSGSSTPAELTTGLQLLYQSFTAAGTDEEAFALLKKQLQAAVVNRAQNPGAVFADKLAEINSSGHYTSRPLTTSEVAGLDRTAMIDFYKTAFANAADFTFFVVGAFDVEKVLPQLERYVGSLPSTGTARLKYKDVGITFPHEIRKEAVRKGREPRAQAVISFFADPPPDEAVQTRLGAATDVLEIALRDIVREELGQTYTLSVGHVQPLPQRGAGRAPVSYTASPENVGTIVDRVLKEVARFQQEPPSADLTNRAKESARRDHEVALKQNGYWLGRLQSSHLLGLDPRAILATGQTIEALTPEMIHATFKEYFPLNRYTVVTLVPETP